MTPFEETPLAGVVDLEVWIGEEGSDGYDRFTLKVSTPEGLGGAVADDVVPHRGRFLRSWLLVDRLRHDEIRMALEDLCRRATGRTWAEVHEFLGRLMSPEGEV